jgi:DNA-binding GntR family transcriptional regulator
MSRPMERTENDTKAHFAENSLESGGMSLGLSNISSLSDTHMLSEQVYHSILQLVTRGQLQRGAPLRIEELSRILNVSPTPVREGLARLEATGLVVHEPRKGFRVAPPLTLDQFERLMDAREVLEVGAAGLAATAGGEGFVTALDEALADQQAAVQRFHESRGDGHDDQDLSWAVIDTDLRFHHVIFEYTGNPFIGLMAEALNGQSHRVRQSAEKGISDDLEALNEHAAIAKAAHEGDGQAVEIAMRAHLDLVRVRSRADLDG